MRQRGKRSRYAEHVIRALLFGCGALSVVTTVGIVAVLLFETMAFFREVSPVEFLTDTQWTPLFADKHFGILPLVAGTALSAGIAVAVAMPIGLLSAIYLSEYASEGVRRVLKPLLEVLAGIPTVVYGYFALLFVTPMLQSVIPSLSGFNALAPGLVMGVMIVPMISSLSEDAIELPSNFVFQGSRKMDVTLEAKMIKIPKQEYTAQFKEQAVKRVGEVGSMGRVAEELGLVEQTLCNWVTAGKAGKLNPTGANPITPEQMELSCLRAENARLKLECAILTKATAYFAKDAR